MRKIIIILIILAVVSTLIGCSTGRGVVEQVSSIPVVSEVEIVKEVSHIPWWSKALSSLGFVFILLIILSIITKNRII